MMEIMELSQYYNLLKQLVLDLAPRTGRFSTSIDGLMVVRREEQHELGNFFYSPMIGITLQGKKCSVIANQTYHYGEGHCIIASIDIPSSSYLTEASPDKPFLAVSLDLNQALCADLIANMQPYRDDDKLSNQSVAIINVQPSIIDAFFRLMMLLQTPNDIPIMAPLIIREIHYRILSGSQSKWLRKVCSVGSQNNQIAKSISWLKQNYKETFSIDLLAQQANMATSTFYKHFNKITGNSPLQFQKLLRLYEAQRLMLSENQNINSAAYNVGYESPTQFIREYKREFGLPPKKDIIRLNNNFCI